VVSNYLENLKTPQWGYI